MTDSNPPARAPLLRLRHVAKTYGSGTVALAAIDLDVAAGEFVTLLGPSGCGKSTVLRLVAGLATPSSGTIEWSDARSAPESSRIGFVFQEPTLMPWASVAANVALPLRLAGVARTEIAARVTEALGRVGLAAFATAYPRELSGGMKMRVSIARALVTRPRVLLLDEPFAALDEITRFRLNNDLRQLWRSEGWTVLFVTHSVYEAVYLSERIVVMATHPGRIASEHAVPLAAERNEAMRASVEYGSMCREVSAALARAMETDLA
jgi:NitT/TauT family transport system ATP-binding protein